MKSVLQILFFLYFTICTSCINRAQTGKILPPEAFGKALEDKQVQLLDVRTAREYQNGHIQGALQADWTNTSQFNDRSSHLDKNRPVYLYCQSGVRSAAAMEYLQNQGFKEVVNMQGGLTAWRKAGYKLEAVDVSKAQMAMQEYDNLTHSNNLVLVDFGAEWCPPCKKMEPVINTFMQEQGAKVKLVKMDGGNEIEMMKTLKVDGLPTFILYKNGQETKRKQGVMTKEELEGWVQ